MQESSTTPKAQRPQSPITYGPPILVEESDDPQIQSLEIPSTTAGRTTFGYFLALKTRIIYNELLPDRALDTRRYPPAFVHDIMMLPGSLSSLIKKRSESDIMDRVTPAILRGYRTIVHPVTRDCCLITSEDLNDTVQGMVIFGQGRAQRSCIHEHYRWRDCRRYKAEVLIESTVPQPRAIRPPGGPRWKPQKTKIIADVWVWTGYNANEFQDSKLKTWILEECLTGAYLG